jgi:hypothetical protein
MKIKRLKITTAADTDKHDYIIAVKEMLDSHDENDHNKTQFDNYSDKARQLLDNNKDRDRMTVLLLST